MLYTSQVLDRKTGELVTIDNGDWITITELGELYNTGSRRTRTILRNMDFLQVEGGGKQHRHRLSPWVTDRGWGKRIQTKGAIPFDVIGPDARSWIAERWSQTVALIEEEQNAPIREAKAALEAFRDERNSYRRSHGSRHPDMEVTEMVSWLDHFFPRLSHSEIAGILDVSQQLVSRYLRERQRERERWKAYRDAPLVEKPWGSAGLRLDQLGEPDVVT